MNYSRLLEKLRYRPEFKESSESISRTNRETEYDLDRDRLPISSAQQKQGPSYANERNFSYKFWRIISTFFNQNKLKKDDCDDDGCSSISSITISPKICDIDVCHEALCLDDDNSLHSNVLTDYEAQFQSFAAVHPPLREKIYIVNLPKHINSDKKKYTKKLAQKMVTNLEKREQKAMKYHEQQLRIANRLQSKRDKKKWKKRKELLRVHVPA